MDWKRWFRHAFATRGSLLRAFPDSTLSAIESAVAATEQLHSGEVRFAIEAKFFSLVFAILTPYPGTALYERLKEEGRLTDERWWLLEDQAVRAPHFHPLGMTREELREGWEWAWREYYSYPAILRRFQWEYPPTLVNKAIYFPFNLLQRRFIRKKVLGGERLGWTKLPWKVGRTKK